MPRLLATVLAAFLIAACESPPPSETTAAQPDLGEDRPALTLEAPAETTPDAATEAGPDAPAGPVDAGRSQRRTVAVAAPLGDVEEALGTRLGGARLIRRVDVRGDVVLFAARLEAPKPETDHAVAFRILRWDVAEDRLTVVAERARDAALLEEGLALVDAEGTLLVPGDDGRRVARLDRVAAGMAVLDDGALVVSRLDDEPGGSTLWRVPADGEPQALAPAAGPNELPIALPGGRIAFVSGRTTVASLWIFDPATGEARQLTNRGLVAGRSLEGFVPPPTLEGGRVVRGDLLVYDAGRGALWQVHLETGFARPVDEEALR
jgi:hypothetical protein